MIFGPSSCHELQGHGLNNVDGRNPANHLGFKKPCKYWGKLPSSTGAGFEPSINSMSTPGKLVEYGNI